MSDTYSCESVAAFCYNFIIYRVFDILHFSPLIGCIAVPLDTLIRQSGLPSSFVAFTAAVTASRLDIFLYSILLAVWLNFLLSIWCEETALDVVSREIKCYTQRPLLFGLNIGSLLTHALANFVFS